MTPWSLHTAISTLVVSLAAVAAFAAVTHGFTALTSESARRAALLEAPVVLPEMLGTDQTGRVRAMLADPEHAGPVPRVTIVDFVYTNCETLCSAQGSSFEQLQAEIRQRHLGGRVRLLTVSFDPARDTSATLAQYALRLHVDAGIWTLLSPTSPQQLRRVLTAFGVVVVPAPLGQFEHNAAFHLLDPTGRLVRIIDAGNSLGALDAAVSLCCTTGLLV